MDDMIGLIPAAGKGMRLGLPYPKELYPVIRDNRYKPIAQFVVENLTAAGLQQIVFVINETKHQLIGYFGNGHRFGCHFTYAVQEGSGDEKNSSPGLAHALAAVLASGFMADYFLPFVYNIGINGFQASMFFRLFAGGLASLYALEKEQDA